MKLLYVFLVCLSACGFAYAQPTVSLATGQPGVLQFTFTSPNTNYYILGIPGTGLTTSGSSYAQWGLACSANFTNPATTTGLCRTFTCALTSGSTTSITCSLDTGNAVTGAAGASNTNTYMYQRSMAPIATNPDPGFTLGSNALIFNTAADTSTAGNFNNAFLQGILTGWTSAPFTVTQLTANPTFTYTLSMAAPDVVNISMSLVPGNYQGVGWYEPQTNYPSWASICTPTFDCVFVQCTNFNTCTAAPAAFNSYQVSRNTNMFVVQRNAVGPSGTQALTAGAQTNMMWMQTPNPIIIMPTGGSAIAPTAQSYRSWAMFSTGPSITPYASMPPTTFTYAMSATSATTVAMTFTTAQGKYDGVGFELAGTAIPAYVVLCDPTITTACVPFTCMYSSSRATMCSAAVTTSTTTTGISTTARTVTFTRPFTSADSTPHVIKPGVQNLLWVEGASVSSLTTAQANGLYTSFQSTLSAYQGTAPTFGVTAAAASTTTTQFDITTNSGKYAMAGVGNGSTTYPPLVMVCEPVSLPNCGIYQCSSATTCSDSTITGVTQTRDAANRHQTVVIPNNSLPSRIAQDSNISFQTTTSTNYLYWVEQPIPAAGLSLSASLAQSQTWNMYLLQVSPQSTTPSFPITFSLPSASTLGISMTPGTGQMAFFGWRQSSTAMYPSDAVICAPSAVSACLDVTCASAASCTTRSTTIYTANSASGTSANLTRAFAPTGAVAIVSGTMMQLAWDIMSTPSGTTALQASSANNRTWKFYTAAVPTATTASSILSIPMALAIATIMYIL